MHGRGRRGIFERWHDRQPRQIRSFVEPALLLLLRRKPAHGYELMAGLASVGFADYPVDPSTIYRTLALLERQGAVVSTVDSLLTLGPPRRVFQITPAGEAYLRQWVEELRATDAVLHRFLEQFDEASRT